MSRIWLISDIHLGVRANNLEWFDIQKSYFDNFFIPNLKKNLQENDVLFILGDVFDNRTLISVRIMNYAIDLITELSSILPVHILCGNHDIFLNSSNEINSLKVFSGLKNVNVYTTPEILELDNLSIGILPWMNGAENESNQVKSWDNIDILFCHSEVEGAMYNNFTKIEHGTTVDLYKNIKKVFSGHIHKPQQIKNIQFLGSPYQLTDGERNNQNAILILDLKTLDVSSIPNTYSPIFKHLTLKEVKKIGLDNLQNDFIKIEFTEADKTSVQKLMKSEHISKRCSFKLIEEELEIKANDDEINITDQLDFVLSFKKFLNDITNDIDKDRALLEFTSSYKKITNV